MNAGLVRDGNRSDPNMVPHYVLTLTGLDRLETGGDAIVSNTTFVAMWFDSAVDDAYEYGIDPAIRKAGYEPVRIDRQEHADKIDDEIVAEIRRSRFLVRDFTCGLGKDSEGEKAAIARGGVYYEAGFAKSLGKPVIRTCCEDLIDDVHFDARQYNILIQLLSYYMDTKRPPYPTKRELRDRTGLSDATLKRHMKALEKTGFVQREQRINGAGDFGSNFYHLEGLIHKLKKLVPGFDREREEHRESRWASERPNARRNAAAKSKA